MLVWKFFTKCSWEVELHGTFSFAQKRFPECLSAASAIGFQCKFSLFLSASLFIWVFFFPFVFLKCIICLAILLRESAKIVVTEARSCFHFRRKRVKWAHSARFLVEAYWSVHGQEKKVEWSKNDPSNIDKEFN